MLVEILKPYCSYKVGDVVDIEGNRLIGILADGIVKDVTDYDQALSELDGDAEVELYD